MVVIFSIYYMSNSLTFIIRYDSRLIIDGEIDEKHAQKSAIRDDQNLDLPLAGGGGGGSWQIEVNVRRCGIVKPRVIITIETLATVHMLWFHCSRLL